MYKKRIRIYILLSILTFHLKYITIFFTDCDQITHSVSFSPTAVSDMMDMQDRMALDRTMTALAGVAIPYKDSFTECRYPSAHPW